jgi:hypothetical protein
MNPEIATNLSLKWCVQIKQMGRQADDYFSSDDYQDAQDAYEMACRNVCGRSLEWVALFANGKITPEGFISPHIRLLHDLRTNNKPIGSSLSGLINSLESDWF